MKKLNFNPRQYLTRKSSLKKVLLEFSAAFMGVLVALALNSWKESSRETEFIHEVVKSIYQDNQLNINHCQEQIDHFTHHVDTFAHYLNDESMAINEIIGKNGGFQFKSASFTGYEILMQSDLVSKINYELVFFLSMNKKSAEMKETFFMQSVDLLNDYIYHTGEEGKRRFRAHAQDLKGSCKNFLNEAVKIDSLLVVKFPYILDEMIQDN